MKVRIDYVTNSSSSSFIVVNKVDVDDDLRNYMKDEYGRFGERLLREQLLDGYEVISELEEYGCEDNLSELDIKNDSKYLIAAYIVFTTEGDKDGDDAWLNDHIPEKYKYEVYRSEAG